MSCEGDSSGDGQLVMEREVARYLATGESDPLGSAFPGSHTFERINKYDQHLREALIQEVQRRERGRRLQYMPERFDPVTWTRRKVEPMIAGLFPAAEREVVLGVAARSIVFLTQKAAHQAIRETPFLSSARTIANVYLHSLGASILGDDSGQIVGLNLERECYVSMDYFADEDPFADYVTHEVAHIFHNCKRETVGLPYSRSREWLLEISFARRETFAYACEAYGRILEQADGREHRHSLLAQYIHGPMPSDDRVEQTELLDILAEAVEARNGWKRILARCSSRK
jgi:hypothetical protein